MVKRGLGRGLEAIIPPAADVQEQVVAIEVEQIDPNPRQPRRRLDEAGLQELAASIAEHGVVQPIVVSRAAGGRYELVAGERRWRACRLLGMATIPAVVKDLSARESTEIALVENVQREDLNPLEEAAAYRMLQEEFGLTQEEVARRVGKSRAQITNTVRLLQLPEKIQGYIAEGLLSAGHGRALLAAPSAAQQAWLSEQIIGKGLSVREAEALVKHAGKAAGRRAKPRSRSESEELVEVASTLAERLGTRVRIKARGGRGHIEVEFYSVEDLERLLAILGGVSE